MKDGETEIEMVERHVRTGEHCIALQRTILALSRASNWMIPQSEDLLVMLVHSQIINEVHLARLLGEPK
jgi:hypothetical protein